MKPIRHGTIHAYTGRGCRCEECVEANRAYKRDYQRWWQGGRLPDYDLVSTGRMRCVVCDEPLAEHAIGQCMLVERRASI